MTQDYSTEWRAALIERDMAVRAIVEFLEASDREANRMTIVRREDRGSSAAPPEFTPYPPGEEPAVLDMLRRVKEQLEKKLKR